MIDQIRQVLGKGYDNLCRVEVVGKNLEDNYLRLQKMASGVAIAPVLKSNAYGHGLVLTAKILDKFTPPFFCVDSLYEAYELLKAGIKSKILVMGYVGEKNLAQKTLPFDFCAYDWENLQLINRHQPQAGVHLFVDTGMHREGVLMDDLSEIIGQIKTAGIAIKGLMSHFGAGNEPGNPLTKRQLENFSKARKMFADAGINPVWDHIGASDAALNFDKYQGRLGNMVRVGVVLYTICPALRLVTRIVQVKTIERGEKSGYAFTYSAKRKTKLAVLPAGYNEGIDRRLSNKGVVKIGGSFCPVVGRVNMNIAVVDVTDPKKVAVGDEVVVISEKSEDLNSVANIAKICGTITYEILVHINPTLKRIVV